MKVGTISAICTNCIVDVKQLPVLVLAGLCKIQSEYTRTISCNTAHLFFNKIINYILDYMGVNLSY